MTIDTLPAPVAARLRRPSWRDPRLVVGVVLVALSVALGSWAVSAASSTTPVWVADGTLTPGDQLTADAVRAVEVRLGEGADHYLRADEPLPEGVVLTRVVDDGELVARSALGDAASLDVRSVAVEVDGALSPRVRKGAVVDVWFVPSTRAGAGAPEPRQVVGGVVVEQIDAAGSGLVVGSSTTLHVLVPGEALPALLAALGDDGTVDVVPVTGSIS
ncbi:hypothetical protein Xcel_2500 [Xylanimonas cellulosilytica DSM 15894]|uniref:SAF domain protein n=1 Tax=Xylanimonas cellulosilytica (strain DSM 15894 / JCM 12276 / CECT 5975 / KCTC 9989 / LMG 20990 / NBRC 107835 / XIL07) TaxID=446471 RepID=D1BWH0_XYLCX|nr:hypothetical protein [Xylanimonas cellulosilytica]ACZ31515.1 hypothetical protein Xcel_2500 [Xylanimonas cellulosilytica DSM 15894]